MVACILDDGLLPRWAIRVSVPVVFAKRYMRGIARLASPGDTEERLHHLGSLLEKVLTA